MSKSPTFSSLAPELLLSIAETITHIPDLNSLLLSNRLFANLLTPLLHKRALDDRAGLPGLHWAISHGFENLAQTLIKNGANVNSTSSHHEHPTALSWAVEAGYEHITKLLLENGAHVDTQNQQWETPLLQAVVKESGPIVRLLLENGADSSQWSLRGSNALDLAVSHGLKLSTHGENLEIIHILLEHGAVGKYFGCGGRHHVLHSVAGSMNFSGKIFTALAENAADINITARNGTTALHVAASRGNAFAVRVLLENGADVAIVDRALMYTALHMGALSSPRSGSDSVIELLLDAGSDMTAVDRNGLTPLDIAILKQDTMGSYETIMQLLRNGTSIYSSKTLYSLLFQASKTGAIDVVRILLDGGIDPSLPSEHGVFKDLTALHCAAVFGQVVVVDLLLSEYSVDVDIRSRTGSTALHAAAANQQEEVVEFLLERGADAGLLDHSGRMALDEIPSLGNLTPRQEGIVRLLCDRIATRLEEQLYDGEVRGAKAGGVVVFRT